MAAKTKKASTRQAAENSAKTATKRKPSPGRPFVKGQSGNPGGRPKTKPFKDALEAELAESSDDALTLRAIARALLKAAAKGNAKAIREVADRLDGKVPQAIAGIDEDERLTPLAAVINLTGRRA